MPRYPSSTKPRSQTPGRRASRPPSRVAGVRADRDVQARGGRCRSVPIGGHSEAYAVARSVNSLHTAIRHPALPNLRVVRNFANEAAWVDPRREPRSGGVGRHDPGDRALWALSPPGRTRGGRRTCGLCRARLRSRPPVDAFQCRSAIHGQRGPEIANLLDAAASRRKSRTYRPYLLDLGAADGPPVA